MNYFIIANRYWGVCAPVLALCRLGETEDETKALSETRVWITKRVLHYKTVKYIDIQIMSHLLYTVLEYSTVL